MPENDWKAEAAQVSLTRLLHRIKPIIPDPNDRLVFVKRLETHFPRIFHLLYELYGWQYDYFYHLEQIFETAAHLYAARPADLKALDIQREAEPEWLLSEKMMGGVCYVDLFAGDLEGLRARIPYFKELGLTYLHLMPLFQVPEGNSDGGYAVSDFRSVRPDLGTMEQLADLARDFRQAGISLCLDFVFNHTADTHEWAQRALAGEDAYQAYFRLFNDRTIPDQYEANLREIFPEQAPGSFTYYPEIKKWVWTTFHNFQWDLNYANPEVFRAMLEEMLFLANQGVEVLRLDAVAFIWKQIGTTCENLPQAHWIIQCYNAWVQVVAPAMVFKSEAIVHPDDVASYIGQDECPISYNPTMMALSWEALATREVKLLRHSMSKRFDITPGCTWVNYVRVHDDIGWSFADEDAAEININGFAHRQFLNRFYTGDFPGSFATGLPFNFNPITLDLRISGTCASLAGLEQALEDNDPRLIEQAIRRILLLHSLILSAGGIPLLYLGDEIATINDYRYRDDPIKGHDSRWAHRPAFDWERAKKRHDPTSIEGRVFQALQHMISVRQNTPELAGCKTLFFDTGNPHVLGYIRNHQLMVLANFSETEQVISRDVLAAYWPHLGNFNEILTHGPVDIEHGLALESLGYVWLKAHP
ncbi:MAG: alpha-amylase family protein [Anaerolineae bacterium]|nr:alpha-amylase family protein [Anaerolineae bacterium]